MPSIITASKPVTNFANGFASPYGSDQIIPLYSSMPLNVNQGNCLPCVACGNSVVRSNLIKYTSTTSVLSNTSLVTTSPTREYTIQYLLIGGGGASGNSAETGGDSSASGGGGAGGVISSSFVANIGSTINIIVGSGGVDRGTNGDSWGGNGGDSIIQYLGNIITAYGGGGGGGDKQGNMDGRLGGSGGGGGAGGIFFGYGGKPYANQGYSGANGFNDDGSQVAVGGGGGGGAGGAGSLATYSPFLGVFSSYTGGKGGDGIVSSITGTATYYAAGGGGAGNNNGPNGVGWPNYGSGGGGFGPNFYSAPGYAGVCILSIPTESYSGRYYGTLASGGALTVGNSKVLVFTSTDATYIA